MLCNKMTLVFAQVLMAIHRQHARSTDPTQEAQQLTTNTLNSISLRKTQHRQEMSTEWLQGTLAGSFGLHCLVELDWMWNLGGEWGAANGGSMESNSQRNRILFENFFNCSQVRLFTDLCWPIIKVVKEKINMRNFTYKLKCTFILTLQIVGFVIWGYKPSLLS